MHVAVDLNWLLQFIFTASFLALGLLYIVKKTASKYFAVDANFDAPSSSDLSLSVRAAGRNMAAPEGCAVCGSLTTKQCSGCKMVKYCSAACQSSHWRSEHKTRCKEFQLLRTTDVMQLRGSKASKEVSLIPCNGTDKAVDLAKKILFPYEEFVELFDGDKSGFPPCGLLNCGNSCFANVVLQCLSYTKPLFAYLLEKGHRKQCRRNDWCFLCEFQIHVERTCRSRHPFSPINILSRLPNIGGNLGYGKQEDAHEFMRFAIDTMQSVCLDEFGGERAVHPSSQETTIIQHIFGGHLQSQVICTKCNNISNQFENMMDLTVEIQGDAASLEECLDQFTAKEELHGENMYKCDRCDEYVTAWKRLTIRRAPNILTIALKRFQSGRFGKLNKRVTFPETLDLRPYMSEEGDGNDLYKLYAVIVHVDMLNASFFGHYICYIKDFCGKWYRIDDCKVTGVDLEDVLLQGAYMLVYSRICARPSCLYPIESLRKEQEVGTLETQRSLNHIDDCCSAVEQINICAESGALLSDNSSGRKVSCCEELYSMNKCKDTVSGDLEVTHAGSTSSLLKDAELRKCSNSTGAEETLLASTAAIGPNCRPASPICDIVGVTGGSRCILSQNHVCEEDQKSSDVPVLCSGRVLDKSRSLHPNSEVKLEEFKCDNDLPSRSGVRLEATEMDGGNSVGRKPNIDCSGPNFKTIFAPGFLGKRTRNKCNMQGNVLEKHNHPVANYERSDAELGLSDQINGATRHEGLSSEMSSVHTVNKISENASQLVTSESISLSSGDLGDIIMSDECSNVSVPDEQLVIQNPLLREFDLVERHENTKNPFD